ncbi:MAG: hypothetical protein V3S55_09655 [Nitrospiraceae bacterium]
MAQITITLSFDVWAKVADELPGPETLRTYLLDELPDDWYTIDEGSMWALRGINVGPQPQLVNAQLLEALVELTQSVLDWNSSVEGVIGRQPDSGMCTLKAQAAIASATA